MALFRRKVGLVASGASVTEIRNHNLSLILHTLIDNKAMSRAEISDMTGLGVTALTKPIRELLDRQLVELDETVRPAAKGRPTKAIKMANDPWRVLGIVCDFRRIEIVLGTLAGGVAHHSVFDVSGVNGFEDYRPHLQAAISYAVQWSRENDCTILATEASVAGAVDHAGGIVARSVLNGWGRVDLRSEITHALDTLGVSTSLISVDRETNYTSLTDAKILNETQSFTRIAYLGGRQAISGAILTPDGIEHGANGLAGEFGHLAIAASNAECWCGRRGCVETKLGISYLFSASTGVSPEEAFEKAHTGYPLMADALKKLIHDEDARTMEVFSEASAHLGRTIDIVAGVVNPSIFLIGGTLAEFQDPLEGMLRDYLSRVAALPSQVPLSVQFSPNSNSPVLNGLIEAGRVNVASNPSLIPDHGSQS